MVAGAVGVLVAWVVETKYAKKVGLGRR